MLGRRVLTGLTFFITTLVAQVTSAAPPPDDKEAGAERVVAIDVLLVPDAKMVERAIALNAEIRRGYAEGYELGEQQVPHISLVHRYAREKDLPAMNAAVAKVCDRHQPLQMKLLADAIASGPWNGLVITSIGVARTEELDRFQEEIVRAVEPFTVASGSAAAFNTNKELPKIEDAIVQYVATFVPKASGKNYNPHVTIGAAPAPVIDRLKARPFKAFEFKPAGVATYQLGSFGTAQKELWTWEPSNSRPKGKQ